MAGKWLSRVATLAVWLLAALSATWWSLKFVGARSPLVTAPTLAAPAPGSDPTDLAKVFGPPVVRAAVAAASAPAPAAVDPSTRLSLVGVVANRSSAGVALISVDGKAARPYRVGSRIEESFTLKSVAVRSAVLEPASPPGGPFTLELAPPSNTALAPPAVPAPGTAPPAPTAPPAAAMPVMPSRLPLLRRAG